jgi:hypothetical protein
MGATRNLQNLGRKPQVEPDFHTTRKSFQYVATRFNQHFTKDAFSSDHSSTHKRNEVRKTSAHSYLVSVRKLYKKRHAWELEICQRGDDVVGSGDSSGSGTEGVHAGSASSHESGPPQRILPSQALLSPMITRRRRKVLTTLHDTTRPMLRVRRATLCPFRLTLTQQRRTGTAITISESLAATGLLLVK